MIVLLDLDGPVANLLDEWIRLYNIDYDDNLVPGQVKTWDMTPYVKESCGHRIYDYLDGEIYDGVWPVPGALDGVKKLQEMGHRVVFVTSSPEGTGDAKYAWLKRLGFLIDDKVSSNYVEAHDKSLVHGDILIDDRIENISNFPGETILWDAPYNRDSRCNIRALNWGDVITGVEFIASKKVDIGPHPTEIRCPQQAAAFREITDKMYRVHLSKNADYSSANVLGLGPIGVIVRAWDKMARLLSLYGFRMNAEFQGYDGEKVAAHESIEDSWLDLANYAIIGMLVRRGVWGK